MPRKLRKPKYRAKDCMSDGLWEWLNAKGDEERADIAGRHGLNKFLLLDLEFADEAFIEDLKKRVRDGRLAVVAGAKGSVMRLYKEYLQKKPTQDAGGTIF